MKFVSLALLLVLLTGTSFLVVMAMDWIRHDQAPEQPISFSHPLHVQKVGMECTDCHRGVAVSPKAGVPGASMCLECHQEVAVDSPGIKTLKRFQESGQPIPWVKVHDLGWHAYFSHRRHVDAGVQCTICHGKVAVMDRVRKVRSLRMGWCVACHRKRNAADDCLTCHK